MRRLPLPYVLPCLILVALAGCNSQTSDTSSDVAPGNFTPPGPVRPTPAAQTAKVDPLAAYVGHYPNDVVKGVSFFDQPEVLSALRGAVSDQALVKRVTSQGSVTVPIFRFGKTGIAAHGCTPHNCADSHWTFIVEKQGPENKGQLCYHDQDKMGDASRWYIGGAPVVRPGPCPQE
ncbi:hypothetical protein RN629_11315 [Sphingomonadaceae bacterium jetA1]|jgi:hypothetical protein|uniref:hypothetical protein n=1 Tax=Facivitalis istanbulensis TaxID=3075838 RepID=UPI00346B476E